MKAKSLETTKDKRKGSYMEKTDKRTVQSTMCILKEQEEKLRKVKKKAYRGWGLIRVRIG